MTEAVETVLVLWTGALLILLGTPLAMGKVSRNRGYGFRTSATLSDDRIWDPMNRLVGRWMIGIGWVPFGVALARAAGLVSFSLFVLVPFMVVAALTVGAVGARRARKLQAALDAQATSSR